MKMPLRQYPHFARNFSGPITDAQKRELVDLAYPSCDLENMSCQEAFDLIKDLRRANEKSQSESNGSKGT